MNATSGEAIMHHNFYDYQPLRGSIPARLNGVMVSTETGRATPFALDNLQDRGILFIAGGEQVYEGQIVGEHCRDNDLPVNVCREKKLTNMRASGTDKAIILKPPRQMTLEQALEYIEDDELVEVTPKAIRLRKIYLKENDRKKFARQDRRPQRWSKANLGRVNHERDLQGILANRRRRKRPRPRRPRTSLTSGGRRSRTCFVRCGPGSPSRTRTASLKSKSRSRR